MGVIGTSSMRGGRSRTMVMPAVFYVVNVSKKEGS